jgi:Cytochrome c554 and c-prime
VNLRNNIAVSFLLAVFCPNLFTGLMQSTQVSFLPEKSVVSLPDKNKKSLQDTSKYLYVGMEKCASVCHNNGEMGFQYNIVKSSPHANAFKILATEKAMCYAKKAELKGNPGDSQVCLKCHITGAGLDSTFFATTYKKEDGITCEACHKGAFIKKTFIPKEADCLICHNNSVHEMLPFNFKENCAKIAHLRPKSKPVSLVN